VLKPKIFLNGYEMPAWGWGRAVYPVPPASTTSTRICRIGFRAARAPAGYTVAVVPGQLVELEYKAPLFTFSRRSLGPPPQRYTGVAATTAVVVALLIFIAWILLLALL